MHFAAIFFTSMNAGIIRIVLHSLSSHWLDQNEFVELKADRAVNNGLVLV